MSSVFNLNVKLFHLFLQFLPSPYHFVIVLTRYLQEIFVYLVHSLYRLFTYLLELLEFSVYILLHLIPLNQQHFPLLHIVYSLVVMGY
jgi:hypothetical protein